MAQAQKPRFIVIGGGLAGLMTVIKICEAGYECDVFSFVPCRRSHSVCAQGGINGAVNTKGEGDSPEIHFIDSVKGGDFLAEQPPIKAMCYAAPGVIYLLDRMGVPFSRTAEGLIDFRRFGGTLHHRTAFAGATTGQQLLYALDEQVRRHEVAGKVRRFERHEFVSVVKDDTGRARGIVAMDLASMKLETFPAAAVALATGGPGVIYGKSTNSVVNTGTAAAVVYQQGASYANGEFIQVHPTAIAGPDKLRLISESLRGEGARVWVPKKAADPRKPNDIPESERWYFLEEKYPKYKNLVPRDVATREIFIAVRDKGLGVGGKDAVYLDIVNPDKEVSQGRGPDEIAHRVEGVVEIYEKFIGDDPREVPMQVFPAVHYSMGGLWVDYDHMTNIPGLFAVGEVDYQYHGANRLGANSLISCLYGGMVCGPKMVAYANTGAVSSLRGGALDGVRRREGQAAGGVRRHRQDERLGEPLQAVVGAGPDDDHLRHRRAQERRAEEGGREPPEDDGALEAVLGAGQRQDRQPVDDVHAAAVEHAGAVARDHRRRAACATSRAARTTSPTSPIATTTSS